MKAIFIDDSQDFCKIMRKRFSEMGFEHLVTDDPIEFVHEMESKHYDFAFVDLVMPTDLAQMLNVLNMYVNSTKLYIMTNNTMLINSMLRNVKERIAGVISKRNLFEEVSKIMGLEMSHA